MNPGQWSQYNNYSINDTVVGSDNNLYTSIIDHNQGHDPTSSPTQWRSDSTNTVISPTILEAANVPLDFLDSRYASSTIGGALTVPIDESGNGYGGLFGVDTNAPITVNHALAMNVIGFGRAYTLDTPFASTVQVDTPYMAWDPDHSWKLVIKQSGWYYLQAFWVLQAPPVGGPFKINPGYVYNNIGNGVGLVTIEAGAHGPQGVQGITYIYKNTPGTDSLAFDSSACSADVVVTYAGLLYQPLFLLK